LSQKDGHYGHGQKITVLFAIKPDEMAALSGLGAGFVASGTSTHQQVPFIIFVSISVMTSK
jgi:hypothetical protein